MVAFLLSTARGKAAEDRSGWFVRAESPFVQDLLTLGHSGAYQMSTVSEGGRATRSGTFNRRGNLLVMSQPSNRVPAELLVVDWGARRYLVEPSRLASFCDFAWKARGQAPPRFPEMVFYRSMDEAAAFPKSLPGACSINSPKTKPDNKALHQTRREGVPASRAIVEARLAGEGRCCTGYRRCAKWI